MMLTLVRTTTSDASMDELPAPLLSSEVNLRDVADMPLDIRRLLTSETWILGSGDEKVAALTLWLESWHQIPAGSLPDNDRVLSVLSQAGINWPNVRGQALKGWVRCSDGRLYHPVVVEKALEVWKARYGARVRTERARQALQKNRDAINEAASEVVVKRGEKRRMTSPTAIQLDEDKAEWIGVTEVHREMWRKIAPGVDIERHLAAAAAWIVSNPRHRKKNYLRYLTGWLTRQQERLSVRGELEVGVDITLEKTSASFQRFWASYPRQTGLLHAWQEWQRQQMDASEDRVKAVSIGLEAWKKSRDWAQDDGKFIPAPAKWLVQLRWLESPQPHKPVDVMTDRYGRTTYDKGDVTRDYGGHGTF